VRPAEGQRTDPPFECRVSTLRTYRGRAAAPVPTFRNDFEQRRVDRLRSPAIQCRALTGIGTGDTQDEGRTDNCPKHHRHIAWPESSCWRLDSHPIDARPADPA